MTRREHKQLGPWLAAILVVTAGARLTLAQAADDDTDSVAPTTGATIETNADAEALLDRAGLYFEEGRTQDGVLLLQHTVEKYGDALVHMGQGRYRPARLAAETVLVDADPEVLDLYRLSVDGKARSLMGGPASACMNINALRTVASQMFYSSEGDDAAYALACLLMDRGDTAEAAYLLDKVLTQHPNPSIDRDVVRARLAAAAAVSGDTQRALALLNTLDTASNEEARRTRSAVRAFLQRHAELPTRSQWHMALGGADRTGVMPTPTTLSGAEPSVTAWHHTLPLRSNDIFSLPASMRNVRVRTMHPQSCAHLINRWRRLGWVPTSQMVYDDRRTYYKSGEVLVALDRETGAALWEHGRQNDQDTTTMPRRYFSEGLIAQNQIHTPQEGYLFGDRVGRSLALIDGLLIHIERSSPYRALNSRSVGRGFSIGGTWVSDGSDNELVAIDPATGRVVWRSRPEPASDKPVAPVVRGRPAPKRIYLSTPVAVAGRLVVPVNDSGEVVLLYLDPATGKQTGRRFICSSPLGFSPPWANVQLAASGTVVYASGGHGLVFAYDVMADGLQWVTYYHRSIPEDMIRAMRMPSQNVWANGAQGFLDNTVIPTGRVLLAAPADSQRLLVYDRLSGKLQHTIPASPRKTLRDFNHVIGVADGRVYLGGDDAVVCYAIESGEMLWEADTPNATGRGALTETSIYMPTGPAYVVIDRLSGKRRNLIEIGDLLDEPAGNLYADGRRLYSAGISGLVALTDAASELDRITERIESGHPEARLARARLYMQLRNEQGALSELRAAHDEPLADSVRVEAKRLHLDLLLKMAQPGLPESDALLREAAELATDPLQADRVNLAMAAHEAMIGRVSQSVERYRSIAVRNLDGLVALTGEHRHSRVRPATAALPQIRKLTRQNRREAIDALQVGGEAELEQALTLADEDERLEALCLIARSHAPAPVALDAARQALALSSQVHVRRFAQVENTLLDLARCGDGPFEMAAGLALIQAYTDRAWHEDADALARSMIERHEGLDISGRAADDTLEKMRSTWSAELEQGDGRRLADAPLATLWYRKQAGAQLMQTMTGDMTGTQMLRDNALIFVPQLNRVTLRQPASQESVWSLALPEDAREYGIWNRTSKVHRGGVWKHQMVLRSGNGLHGYDLAEGGRIWTAPIGSGDSNLRIYLNAPNAVTSTFDLADGVYVERYWDTENSTDVLVAHDAFDGRVIWTRRFAEHTLNNVRIRGGWVCLVVDDGKALWLCDRWTGQVRRELSLTGYNPRLQMEWTQRGVVYRDNRGVRFLPIDGVSQAVSSTRTTVRRIFPLGDDHAVVYWQDGGLSLLDLRLGREPWYLQPNAVHRRIQSVAMTPDGDILVTGYMSSNQPAIRVLDLQTGQTKQTLAINLALRFPIDAERCATIGPVLPFLDRSRTNHRYSSLHWYNRETGEKLAGPALHVPASHGYLEQVTTQTQVRGGVMLISTEQGLLAIGPAHAATTDPAASGLYPAVSQGQPQPRAQREQTRIETNNGTIIIQGDVNGRAIRLTPEQIREIQQQQGGNVRIRIQNGEIQITPQAEQNEQQQDQQQEPRE